MTVEQLTEKLSNKHFDQTYICERHAPFVARIIKILADEHLSVNDAIEILDETQQMVPCISGIRLWVFNRKKKTL